MVGIGHYVRSSNRLCAIKIASRIALNYRTVLTRHDLVVCIAVP